MLRRRNLLKQDINENVSIDQAWVPLENCVLELNYVTAWP